MSEPVEAMVDAMIPLRISRAAAELTHAGPYHQHRLRDDTVAAVRAGRHVRLTTTGGSTVVVWGLACTLYQARDLGDWLVNVAHTLKSSNEPAAEILAMDASDVAMAIRRSTNRA